MSRYQYTAIRPVPQRASLNHSVDVNTEDLPGKAKPHVLFFAGIGMLLVVACYVFGTQIASPFIQGIEDHWQYGQARISQYDFNVGHGGISHFLAEEYGTGQIVVIEIDPTTPVISHVYVSTLFGNIHTQEVVTLTATDVNHDGKPDLEIYVSSQPFPLILFNNGKTFQGNPPNN